MKQILSFAAAAATLFLAGCEQSPKHPFSNQPVVIGKVTDQTGQPLGQALVSVAETDSTLSISTLTDDRGRFVIPVEPLSSSRVWIRGVGIEPQNILLSSTGGEVSLVAQSADPYHQVPSSSFLNMLPEGEAKRKFILDCTGCHQFDSQTTDFNGKRKTRDLWVERTQQMIQFFGAETRFPIMAPSRHAEESADWLVAHLGEDVDPPPIAISEVEASHRVTITEFPIPVRTDLPHDLMFDGTGRVLITGMMTHQMYLLDPDDGSFDAYPIPVEFANPRALDVDLHGNWWVLLGFPQKIARYRVADSTWSDWSIGMYPHSIVRDATGRIWFNGHFTKRPELIGVLDPATGAVQTYEVPTDTMEDGGSTIPYGLRIGPDGSLWMTQLVGSRLIRFDPATEAFDIYDFPERYSGPRRPDIAPDGTVWIPEYSNNKLARFDPQTETFSEYQLPIRDALPYIVRVHRETGDVWVATAAADAVLRFNLAAEQFTVYRTPTQSALMRHMEIDPATGAVWVAYGNSPAVAPAVARIEPWDR